jgi:ABC-type multidrug transport system ATPase subunit
VSLAGPLLAAAGVGRRFGDRWALRGASLTVGAGESVALVGPNGAGKTTLLSILAGALEPTEGTVPVSGRDAGLVPQRPALWRRLSARENLELLARLGGLDEPTATVEALLRAGGLAAVADRPVNALSVGLLQRVNVAAGLLGDPAVVLLDEPTAALDPRQRRLLWSLLGQVTDRGGAVVFTTHNVEEIGLHADRMVGLDAGVVVFDGTVAAFREVAAMAPGEPFEHAFVRFLDAVDGAV